MGDEYTPAITLIAVPIFVSVPEEVDAALERAAAAARDGAQVIEWRADALAEQPGAADALRRLVAESPVSSIVTCRPTWEGGLYDGDEASRVSLFEDLATAGEPPRYLDVELAALRRSANLRQKVLLSVEHDRQVRSVETGLILSAHDFEGRPADLLQRIEAMQAEPACAIVKIAWLARSLRDNLEVFDLLRERSKPTIALCMGPFGLMSRVLAPKFGGFLTFAADAAGAESAPGQPTLAELRERYRFGEIGPATRVYGVIGWPVAHSRGPEIHNRGFARVGHDGVYLPLPVPAEWEHFKATVGALLDHDGLDFRGASVTLPHKAHLVRFVEERGGHVDPLARLIGAANTLVVGDDGALACRNTDCPAAVDALCAGMEIERSGLAGRRIAVIGAGGVGRALAVGFADAGATVVVFNRDPARAEALAAELNGRPAPGGGALRVSAGRMDALACGCFHVFANATPVGMAGGPDEDGSPLPEEVSLDDTVTVFDTVYAPRRTPLLAEAAARGARPVSGWSMFLRQAALQFRAWTGAALGIDLDG